MLFHPADQTRRTEMAEIAPVRVAHTAHILQSRPAGIGIPLSAPDGQASGIALHCATGAIALVRAYHRPEKLDAAPRVVQRLLAGVDAQSHCRKKSRHPVARVLFSFLFASPMAARISHAALAAREIPAGGYLLTF